MSGGQHFNASSDVHEGKSRKGARIIKWKGDVPLPEIPNVNFAVLLLKLTEEHAEEIAMVDSSSGKSYTYRYLRERVLKKAYELSTAGVGFGDAVIVLSINHVEMPSVILAIMLVSATCVPVNPALTKDELGHIIYVSEAKWAVVNEKAVEKTKAAFSALGSLSLRKLWTMDGSPGTSLGDQMRLQSLDLPSMKDGFDSARVVALMPFSSGTTGFPKGVMLSHRNLVTTYASTMFVRSLNPDIKFNIYESALLFLPMYHMYGYNIMMNTFTLGGKLVLLNKFSPKKFLEAIQKYKVTFAPVVPYVMRILVETPLINQYDLSSLYGFLTGSAPVAGKTLDALSEKSGRISIQGYALTESCGTGSANRGLPGTKSNSVGYFGPFFKAKVIDVATGEMLGEMEEGELCLQGPSIMMGYANNPKATAETIDSEGWLHTGDLAYFNEEDEVFITDRMKDLIKVKGYQVSPAELEALIQKLDNVSEVAVAGVPDARLGEVPRAWIVPVPGTTIDKKAVMKHVADNVVAYKQLSGVEITDTIPKNHIGKYLRRELRKTFMDKTSKL